MPFLARSSFLFLKSIELAGFKSFARPTRLELPPGITALVGPNGSGKSNIVDAVRWCLGEQNARDLRAQRADEVIHAGPRRVLGLAEVSLALECAEGDDQRPVTLGRRLFRSGESEYLVNGDRARLRDLLTALREVGIDGSRYIVVNQGMADSFLAATPQERRALLEHAAGLSGYRAQRDEAKQKLATTTQNVQTIEMVLAEMEPRLRSLRRQARAVEDREEAVTRLRSLSESWYAARWEEATAELAHLTVEAEAAGAARQRAETELRQAEEAMTLQLQAERAHRARLETARAALHTTQRESDAARFRCRQLEEQRQQRDQAEQGARQRALRVASELAESAARLAEAETELQRLSRESESLGAELQPARERLEAAQSELAALEAAERSAQLAREDVARRRDRLGQERSLVEETLTARHAAVRELQTQLHAGQEALTALDRERAAHGPSITAALAALERCRARLAAGEEGRDLWRRRMQRLRELRSRIQTECARLQRRADAAAASLVAAERAGEVRRLAGLRVPSGWEVAVSAALAAWSVAGDDSPRQWPDGELEAFRAWRQALPNASRSGGSWGDEFLGLDAGQTAHPLLGTVFTVGEAEADDLWARLVPRDAHHIGSPPIQVVSKSGVIRSALGRSAARDDRALQYLELRSEQESLGRRLRARQRLLVRLQEEESAAAVTLAMQEEEIAVMVAETADAQAAYALVSRRGQQLERERWRLGAEVEAAQDSLQKATCSVRDLELRLQQVGEQLSDAVQLAAQRERDWEPLATSLAERREEVARAGADVAALGGRSEVLGARRAQHVALVAAARREAVRLRAEQSALEQQASRQVQEAERLAGEAEAARLQLDDLTAVVREQQLHLDRLEAEFGSPGESPGLGEPRQRLADAMRAHERAAAHADQFRREVAELREEIARELGIAPEALPPASDQPPLWEEIRRLRSRAAQYAEADDSCVREYQELNERYSGLTRHVADLNRAMSDLREIMATADREMQQRFGTALAAVDEEFSRIFEIMLGGGQARLEEVDDDGGIGIRAQLPGRRARSSNAFSGGERTLVASSLLFGVLKIRPTPFCVLDEVDAALDESNVDRYLAALREIGRRTQVIVVTHNRATMAAADALYGVTMQEEGVSSLLSLRLEEYEAVG